MKAFAIWLRRGSGRFLYPLLCGFLLLSLLSQPDWQVELDWATRLTGSSTLVVCAAIAAVAALDTSRHLRPTLALLGRGSVRRSGQIALPAAAVVAWASASFLTTWVVAAGLVAAHGGVGVHDWWAFAEIVAPLYGAGALGLLVGMVAGPRVAPPAAALAVVAATVVAAAWGRGPFEAVTTYGTLTGLERPPEQAATVVAGVTAFSICAFVAALEMNRFRGARRIVTVICVALMAVAAVTPAAWPWKDGVYRFTTEPYGCVGSRPAVCAPRSRLPLLHPVQQSLAKAYVRLAGTEFVTPTAFRVTRLDHYANLNGAAPLDFDPADVKNGIYGNFAVARALVRPHQCAELFTASSAAPLLDAQQVVVPWLTTVLSGQEAPQPVPPRVASAFQLIQNCRVMTWDLR